MEVKHVNDYIETIYNELQINEKKSLVVCTSERKSDSSLLVDIRLFRLYKQPGEPDDGIMRPTPKGIKFKVDNIPDIVAGLVKIYMDHTGSSESEAMDDINRQLQRISL